MLQFSRKTVLLLILLIAAAPAIGKEPDSALREAERLYQSGRYEEASKKALEIHKFFPDDFQTLLVLGMSSFNAKDYLKASDWFRLAQKQSPKHPIVTRYIELLREIEYRTAPFHSDPVAKASESPYETARFYRKSFFGPGFTWVSRPDDTATPSYIAPLALPTPYPPIEIASAETFAEMAEKAFKEGAYHKAYLFFSQLTAVLPANKHYLIGKAESAFHMKRYRQVIEILGPMMSATGGDGFSEEDKKKAEKILGMSRQLFFSSGR